MKKILFISISLLNTYLFSQITFEKTKHDFGDLTITSDRFVDIIVTNKTPKKEYLLSVKKPPNVVYLVNGQFMEKDGQLTVRLQANPKNKGRFSYEVEIFTSDKDNPTVIKLTGNLTEEISTLNNSLQACPDFNSRPESRNATDFELTVITIDKETKQFLELSTVTILQNGIPKGSFSSNKKGEVKRKIPLGFTYFYVTHQGYLPKELGGYVNFQRNKIILELEKNPSIMNTEIVVKEELSFEEKPIKEVETTKELEKNLEKHLTQEIKKEEPIDTHPKLSSSKFEDLDLSNFDDSNFKPLNVTFVLDISASMQAGEKMELMKFSLYQIIEMLRKQDKISIVTYSTETKVDLPTTSGIEKEKIKELVEKLKAGGLTAGGSGIKLGYNQTLSSLIPDGTNQIVVITDGAFNRNSDDYKNHIEKYKKKGINMTVVGILNSEQDKKSMQNVAQLGGGRYVSINKLSEALTNLKQEMRFISFRR